MTLSDLCPRLQLTLTIRPARVKDVGRYQVSLSNALGQADSAADVKVKKTYQAPHFAQKITDLQQVRGLYRHSAVTAIVPDM